MPSPTPRPAASPLPGVVCVLGQTGAGKSRLGAELARAIDGEVVNADAMQLHDALPIATARTTSEQTLGVPHHLFGVVPVPVPTRGGESSASARDERGGGGYGVTVRDYRAMALPVVEGIIARGKVPVLVGGSDYYARAIVSRSLLDDQLGAGREGPGAEARGEDDGDARDDGASASEEEEDGDDDDDDDVADAPPPSRVKPNENDAAAALARHARLREVDPVSAAKLHPNNARKVRRYLEIYDAFGEPASVVFARGKAAAAAAAAAADDESPSDTSARYRSLCLVLRADASELEPALARRVDAMVDAGLVAELEAAAAANVGGGVGVSQSIGFHEWVEYLRARAATPQRDVDAAIDAMKADAIEAMKADTRRLARAQLRRCKRLERTFGWRPTYLDATATHAGARVGDAARADAAWREDVFEPALRAARAFVAGEDDGGGGGGGGVAEEPAWEERRCDACERTLRGDAEWRAHVSGRRHRKRVASLRKKREGKHGVPPREKGCSDAG